MDTSIFHLFTPCGARAGRHLRPRRRLIALTSAITMVLGVPGVALLGATTLASSAAAAPAGLTLTNPLTQLNEFPGNGGALTSQTCPTGDVMVGLSGQLQKKAASQVFWITDVVTSCQPMAVSGGAVVPTGAIVQVGPAIGAAGNNGTFNTSCPTNQVVVGFEVWSESSGNTSGVHGYQISCSALNASGVPVGTLTTALAGAKSGDDSNAQMCPPVGHAGTPGGVGAGYAGAGSNNGRTAGVSLWCGVVVQAAVAAPTLAATTPTSPGNVVTPTVTGTAPVGAAVSLFTNATCQGTAAVTGLASDLSSGIAVTVPANATTPVSALATISGVDSPCSNSLSYLEDSIPPTLSGAATTAPNDSGWYKDDVAIGWTCGDAGSDIATCPANSTITGEGSNLSATATAIDNAGNSTSSTVSGIKIDRSAPTSIATIAGAEPSGWYNTLPLTVTLSALDNLSGVSKIHYSLDGVAGAVTGASGAVAVTTTGEHTLSMSATDAAGNVEASHEVTIDVDTVAPIITSALDPAPIGIWNHTRVTASVTCSDQTLADGLAGSGVATCSLGDTSTTTTNADQSQTATVDLADEGRFTLPGAASDVAGNTSSLPVPANIDLNGPVVTAKPDRASNGNGWYTAPLTVTFSCGDPKLADGTAGSGVVSCPTPVTLGSDGANQSVAGTSEDLAGNTGSGGLGGIDIDQVAPAVSVTYNGSSTKQGWYDGPVTVHFSCTDATSGVATCPADVTFSNEGTGQSASVTATDSAGNAAPLTVNGINIDLTAPTISGHMVPAANSAGWNDSDVTITWTCLDPTLHDGTPGSGVTECRAPQTVTSEGSGQTFSATATDVAGNTSDSASATVNLDKTAPSLAGTPTAAPDGKNGWYVSPVTIHWTASDELSKIDTLTLPADSVLISDGTALTATASVADIAGNSTTTDSAPVNIDQTAPSTSLASGPPSWSNSSVTLTLAATDNVSGVAATHYSVDGGAEETGTTVIIDSEGRHQLAFYSVDNAGNIEAPNAVTVNIDKTAPTVAASQFPAANGAGWNNSPVTVTFACTDPLLADGTAGAGLASCTSSPSGTSQLSGDSESGTATVVISAEGANQAVDGAASDNAGNNGSTSTTVSIDTTAPTISGLPASAPNGNGWYNNPVTVNFSCDDPAAANGTDGSGVASCDDLKTLSSNGADQSLTGNVLDVAGNGATATVSGLNLDQIAPNITPGLTPSVPNGSNGWYTTPVTVHFAVSDALSGVDPVTVPTDQTLSADGANQEASASVSDLAGNVAPATTGKVINIDQTAPTVTFSQSVSTPNANGWYNEPVTVTFTCIDATSGVAACPPAQLLTTGKHAAQTVTVLDKAGNSTSITVPEIDVDTVAPLVTFSGNAGAYAIDQTVTIGCLATDNLSGIDAAHTTCPSVNAPAYTLLVGKNNVVQASATDMAGNVTSTSTSFTIAVSCPSLTSLVKTFVPDSGVANGLNAKLSAACSAPNANAKAGQIGAFDNQVRAQTGKALTAAQADYLTRFAGML
jgi:hypothetical protein